MAAHCVTVMSEMIAHPDHWGHMKHGLGYAMFGDNFDFDDWRMLNQACDNGQEAVIGACKSLLPKYNAIWYLLNMPKNAEEWQNAMYGNGDISEKTRAKLRDAGLW